jgi:3-phosphoshikimate 1-carboxyvinyltransferase
MRQRPVEPLLESLRQLGVDAFSRRGNGCPPLQVNASGLPGGSCRLPGEISSQFLSALLLSGPYASKGLSIEIEGELTSRPYVRMTISMMNTFGVQVRREGFRTFQVAGGGAYRGRDYLIEGDAFLFSNKINQELTDAQKVNIWLYPGGC